jgi:phosphoribosyl-ATP pyrophosphohydrolase
MNDSKYLDIDYLKENATQDPISFGLGFVQLRLSDTVRMHFYDDSLKTVSEEEVHDHRYNFTSKILRGTLTQTTYDFVPNSSMSLFSATHIKSEVSCNPNAPIKNNSVAVLGILKSYYTATYAAGSSYTIGADVLHTVDSSDAITLLTRHPTFKDYAIVAKRINVDSTCPFANPLTPDECWNLISRKLGVSPEKGCGYHIENIQKGVVGEASKILEEAQELMDAENQNAKIMQHIELSDLYGAMLHYMNNKHPGLTMKDLEEMHNITKRAFDNGHR